ncbi:hypothetical protein E2C01_021074 [Portunus trituberculatus]|uniref:Uncharacterized protein n=1 Tax=Portunus trituberculatus TaxID=210409 RepID=A0A5B7E3E9_PORTR|nr:hypothetical protein [Portunus trituberculatus]
MVSTSSSSPSSTASTTTSTTFSPSCHHPVLYCLYLPEMKTLRDILETRLNKFRTESQRGRKRSSYCNKTTTQVNIQENKRYRNN